ncbi:hypothetical protein EVAR_39825_1 [Eumeta japonica]|uniref:Uncharacterized protein n=1 Tax=Eumeta variegata TaxID=151549 RepID=A0A4C1X7A1_EUMVA|nr:hypothetical protein EVAR_39825_1 [Eumeta japonica]
MFLLRDYGYLGPSLQQMVSKLRTSPTGGGSGGVGSGGGGAVAVVTCTPPLLPPSASPSPSTSHSVASTKTFETVSTRNMVISSGPAPLSPAPVSQSALAPPPQKFVIVTSQPKTSQSQPSSSVGHVVVQQPTIIRSQPVQSVVVTSGPSGSGSGQGAGLGAGVAGQGASPIPAPSKVVVVSMSGSGALAQHGLAPTTSQVSYAPVSCQFGLRFFVSIFSFV